MFPSTIIASARLTPLKRQKYTPRVFKKPNVHAEIKGVFLKIRGSMQNLQVLSVHRP
jgi:hypothetical protein